MSILKEYISSVVTPNRKKSIQTYYFSARYPGDESFFAKEEDVVICWKAVEETKKAVDIYMKRHKKE